jgi:hypothetical protein
MIFDKMHFLNAAGMKPIAIKVSSWEWLFVYHISLVCTSFHFGQQKTLFSISLDIKKVCVIFYILLIALRIITTKYLHNVYQGSANRNQPLRRNFEMGHVLSFFFFSSDSKDGGKHLYI